MTTQMTQVISRIAPTPSGFLHLGNLYNFVLTWWLVRKQKGALHLRIDDVDATRMRPEFVEDIFRTLDYLGLDYDQGPSGPDDFFQHYSQAHKKDQYWQFLSHIKEQFVCECSRKQIQNHVGSSIYPGTCHNKQLIFEKDQNAIKLKVLKPSPIKLGNIETDLAISMGDFVIWRKDDLPAYQLVSLVDDLKLKVNLLVRGLDLFNSSLAQLYLARVAGAEQFSKASFVHHPLLTDQAGQKLSKSQSATSFQAMREAGMSSTQLLQQLVRQMLPHIPYQEINNIKDLLNWNPPSFV